MDMTNAQRLILSNQYKMMADLQPEQAKKFHRLQTIVERGYSLQMRELDKNFGCISEQECREIIDIMEMHHAMQESYKMLVQSEQSQVDDRRLKFLGFDIATEHQAVNYVRFIVGTENMYPQFADESHHFNAQVPMFDKYKRMFTTWQQCPRQYHLSAQEITQILSA